MPVRLAFRYIHNMITQHDHIVPLDLIYNPPIGQLLKNPSKDFRNFIEHIAYMYIYCMFKIH